MTSICLSMIVKNELRVIERCIASVRHFISHWSVVDTGSTDGTQDVVRRALDGIPGELHERPWRNFGENRTEAIELARDKAAYSLVIDADDMLEPSPWFSFPSSMNAHAYKMTIKRGDLCFPRLQIFSNQMPWRYEGIVHEVAVCEAASVIGNLDGVLYRASTEGSRSNNPRKYLDDAYLLEDSLRHDQQNVRSMFYCAQSYRDAGDYRAAIFWYDACANQADVGSEERWYSLLQIACMFEWTSSTHANVTDAYLLAYRERPSRAEPLYELARYSRMQGDYALAHVFACAAIAIPRPEGVLFRRDDVYAWRALDEYAVACSWVGKRKEAARAFRMLLASKALPDSERERIRENTAALGGA